MEAKITIKEVIKIDLIFCWVLDKTIHLGMNPNNGGIPANDKIKMEV